MKMQRFSTSVSVKEQDWDDDEYEEEEEEEEEERVPAYKKLDPNAVKSVDLSFCDIFKNEPAPKPMANKDYPEWLWRITEKAPHLEDLDLVEWKDFSENDKKRLFKFERRRKIKQHNACSRKR
jgi:hypothetical protein